MPGRKLVRRRTVEKSYLEAGLGLGMLAYGAPRIRQLGPALQRGMKQAPTKARRDALIAAEAVRLSMLAGTQNIGRYARSSRTLSRAADSIPANIRPEVLAVVGAMTTGHAAGRAQERRKYERGSAVTGW